MHDETIVNRFIESRARGVSYARLSEELGVSKPTLITWSRKHQFKIKNLKAVEMEALAEKWLGTVAGRMDALGGQLQAVEAELARRKLSDLGTPQLYSLSRSLRRQIGEMAGQGIFTSPISEIPAEEFHEEVQDWNG